MKNHLARTTLLAAVALVFCITPATSRAQMFATNVDYTIGGSPLDVDAADFDGDGDQDLAAVRWSWDSVSILLGNGDGTFEIDGSVTIPDTPFAADVGDLDGNGTPDMAVINSFIGRVIVVFGNGDGSFQGHTAYTADEYPSALVIGDLNNDKSQDLAVANGNPGNVSVLLNNGDGTFQSAVNYDSGTWTASIAMEDLDGDGNQDVVTVDDDDTTVTILRGNGDGTLQPAIPLGSTGFFGNIAIGDMDGDSIQDLVVRAVNGNVGVFIGNGDATFQTPILSPCGNLGSLAVSDLDLDGNQDLVGVFFSEDLVAVLLGNGDGTFQEPMHFGDLFGPEEVTIADLDGNGYPDLAVANMYGDTVSVLINTIGTERILAGPGPSETNSPLVRVFKPEASASHEYEFAAYGATSYGVKVSSGDPDGDGLDEILTGAGPGAIYGPHVRGFDANGTPVPGLSFLAYGTNKYGVNVCGGDLDGDGRDELITGAGPGAVFGPHVRAWDYDDTSSVSPVPGVNYFAYGTPKWGVNVAAGDIDGDGFDEIVTGAGPGAVYGPHVRGWNVDDGAAAAIPEVSFLAYGTNKYGVNVSCGDLDGDGIDEIVTGAGPGAVFGPHVRGWNYDGTAVTPLPGFSFFTWDTEPLSFGANVFAGADLNDDNRDELVVGRGPGPDADTEVKVFTYDGVTVSQWISLEAFPGLTHGATVTAGRF